MKDDLIKVRDWAKNKLQGDSEPPWTWYQYMKLVETCDALLKGMDVANPTVSLQQSEGRPGGHLRLVGSTHPQDNAQRRPTSTPVHLPT